MAGWLRILKLCLFHFFPFYAFVWNTMCLKKARAVTDFGIVSSIVRSNICSYQRGLGSVLGRCLISCESQCELNLSKAWLLCRASLNGHTHKSSLSTCLLNAEILLTSPSEARIIFHQCYVSAEGLQGERNTPWYPFEASLLDNGDMFWLISWSHKGYCYANSYLHNFWLKVVAWNKLFL